MLPGGRSGISQKGEKRFIRQTEVVWRLGKTVSKGTIPSHPFLSLNTLEWKCRFFNSFLCVRILLRIISQFSLMVDVTSCQSHLPDSGYSQGILQTSEIPYFSDKSHMISLICGIQKIIEINEQTQPNKNRHTDAEYKLVVTIVMDGK